MRPSAIQTTDSRETALKIISGMRFGKEKSNYFFILSKQGSFLAYPARPDLVGVDSTEMKSEDEKYIVKEVLARSRDHGSGFLEYLWENPQNRDHWRQTHLF